MNQTLNGKVAIITGGAGGIGKAVSARLARAGASVVVADIMAEAAESVAAELRAAGLSAIGTGGDIGVEDDVRALVDFTIKEFGRIDIIDNNAARNDEVWSRDRTLVEMEADDWDAMFATNVRGPMLLCKHAIPHMIGQGEGGAILNTSSLASTMPQADSLTAYGSSKGALNSLTLYIAEQYGKDKIRCNAILCGVVLTDSLKRLLGDETVAYFAAQHKLGKPSVPEDIAEMVHFLVSDSTDTITGQIFRL